MQRASAARDARSSGRCSRSRATCATSPRTTRTCPSRCCGSRNVLGPDIVTPLSPGARLPLVPSMLGFDPRLQFVHEDDVIRSILFVLEQRHARGSSTSPATACSRGARWPRICGKRSDPAAAGRSPGWPSAPLAPPRARRPARRVARAPALRPRGRQPPPQAGRLPLPLHLGRHGRVVRRGQRLARDRRRRRARVPLRARRRELLPPLPRRRARGRDDAMRRGVDRTADGVGSRHARRSRPPQRPDRPDGRRDRRRLRRPRGRRRRRRRRRHRRAAGVLRRRRPRPPRPASARRGRLLRPIYEGFLPRRPLARCRPSPPSTARPSAPA